MSKSAGRISFIVISILIAFPVLFQTRDFRQKVSELKRTQRLSQVGWAQSLKEKRDLIRAKILSSPNLSRQAILTAQAATDGDSYVSIIPYVTTENNTRTNLGLNNFTTDSAVQGPNPVANVAIGMFDAQGNQVGQGAKTVQSNQMLQTNNIVADLGGSAPTGWLLIFSDEPVTAWASVIFNSSNDPSVELAVSDQVYKPGGFVESQGTIYNPLMILSSTKAGAFVSSLVVANIGSGDGILTVKLYGSDGTLINTLPSVTVKANGMYINNDIRSTKPGTFGPIVITLADAVTSDNNYPRIVAASIVKSNQDTSSFFPAFALPQSSTKSIAAFYTGSLTGTLINAQVEVVLFQERDMLYGSLDITSGSWPTTERSFLISGEVINNKYLLQIQDAFDTDTANTFFAYRLFGDTISGNTIQGDTIYFDEKNQKDIGGFTLTRSEAIYPNS